MFFRNFACLLLCTAVYAQVAKPASTSTKSTPSSAKEPAKSGPDQAVITLQGLCTKPATKSQTHTTSAECKTTVPRAEFEKIAGALNPGISPESQKQLADGYAMALVMAQYAHEKGLDHGPDFEEIMKIMRIQAMERETVKHLRAQAALITDKDIQDYYNKNINNYQEADLERIFIPKYKQITPKENQNSADVQKERNDSEAEMKKEADSAHADAVAGKDFGKLQSEAFDAAGMKVQNANTKLSKLRATNFPVEQRSIFELKLGAVSDVIASSGGYVIYKIDAKSVLPLSSLHDEIRNTLQTEKFQASIQAIQKSVQLSFDDQYFKTPPRPQNAINLPPGHPQAPVASPR